MVRVIVVGGSIVSCIELITLLSRDPSIDLISSARDLITARDLIIKQKPDVVVLDIGNPKMDSLTFLKKLMKHHPVPVIIISSAAERGNQVVIDALHSGAVDIFSKSSGASIANSDTEALKQMIRSAGKKKRTKKPITPPAVSGSSDDYAPGSLIAIGASTGGTKAIEVVLRAFPANSPPVIIVQHMPEDFTDSFAKTLNRVCSMTVAEAAQGDLLTAGKALLAPGGYHLTVKPVGGHLSVSLAKGPRVNFQRPAVDVTFQSIAKHAKEKASGILLTGMGTDGAAGLLAMRQAGSHTIAQDESTSIVFGMPKAAIDIGAAEVVLPLFDIAGKALDFAANLRRAA